MKPYGFYQDLVNTLYILHVVLCIYYFNAGNYVVFTFLQQSMNSLNFTNPETFNTWNRFIYLKLLVILLEFLKKQYFFEVSNFRVNMLKINPRPLITPYRYFELMTGIFVSSGPIVNFQYYGIYVVVT